VVGRARAAFRRFCPPALLLGLLLALANRTNAQAPQALPEIQIISTSPFSRGGIDRDNIARCAAAGAEIFVAGTAVFGHGDPANSVRELLSAAVQLV